MANLDPILVNTSPWFAARSGQNVRDTNNVGNGMPAGLVNEHAEEEEKKASSTSNAIQLKFHEKFWKLLLSLALVAMYPTLLQVVQLKFTNKSPFETHAFFSNMSVAAYVVAIPAAVAFFAMASFFEGSANANGSRRFIYIILRFIFCFSVILANLLLVLLLLIPTSNYYWIGYLIISLLFVFITTYNVFDCYKKHHQRQESSSSDTSHPLVEIKIHNT